MWHRADLPSWQCVEKWTINCHNTYTGRNEVSEFHRKKYRQWPTSSWNAIQPLMGWRAADGTDIRPKLQMTAWQQPYHGSSIFSQPHYRGPIPHQSVLDLWWTEWQCERVFSKDFGFPVTTLPSVIHTHFIHPLPILWNNSK